MSYSVYLDGNYCPIEEAKVSVLDRGFLFAEAVYERIPVYGGKIFALEAHLKRLAQSLTAVQIPNPHTDSDWKAILEKLVQAQDGDRNALYIQVSRGANPERLHTYPESMTPSVFAMCRPMEGPTYEPPVEGFKAITQEDIRWHRCDIKSTNLLPNVMASMEAKRQGANEAILIRNGIATEGSSSNLFIVKDNVIITPPKSPEILGGITRDIVISLYADASSYRLREDTIKRTTLESADEIWITSSTREVMPITLLDDRRVGTGEVGPVWKDAHQRFQAFKANIHK